MSKKIEIHINGLNVAAELNDSQTAKKILEALPVSGKVNTWGEEIYFAIPLALPPEEPKEVVQLGDIGYWPPGKAICLFFGKTPISVGNEIRPASPVNIIGKILDDPKLLKKAEDGEKIEIFLAE